MAADDVDEEEEKSSASWQARTTFRRHLLALARSVSTRPNRWQQSQQVADELHLSSAEVKS